MVYPINYPFIKLIKRKNVLNVKSSSYIKNKQINYLILDKIFLPDKKFHCHMVQCRSSTYQSVGQLIVR